MTTHLDPRAKPPSPLVDILQQAVVLHRQGDVERAGSAYRKILVLEPSQVDALYLLGVTGLERRVYSAGLAAVARALAVSPDFAQAHGSRGTALQGLGRLAEAIASHRKALALAPNDPVAHSNLGSALQEAARLEDAIASHDRALALAPLQGNCLGNKALALKELGRLPAALSVLDKALAVEPDNVRILCNRGAVLDSLARPVDALAGYDRALALSPADSVALRNRGAVLHALKRLDEALESCEAAHSQDPHDPHALYNRGLVMAELKRFDAAIRSYDAALVLRPAYGEVFNNRANVLNELKRTAEALIDYNRALVARADYAEAHSNKIMVLDLDPDTGFPEHQAARRRWYESHGRHLARDVLPHTNDRDPSRRIRLGYVSADFRNHSAALVFGAILRRHDRRHFEVVCYSDVVQPDQRTRFFEGIADIWRPVRHLSDEALAERIREDRIDLLIDLAGHSAGNRLRVFARKPAPIQLTGLGYGAGTGVPLIDYLISDPITVPPAVRPLFAERILDLPISVTYEAPADIPGVAAAPALARGTVTFGCFNQFTKISGHVLALWARILDRVAGSRLLLKDPTLDDTSVRAYALRTLEKQGIGAERVVMRGRTSHREHLAAYGEVDIALDPFPYGGGVTTWEALTMGCPVVAKLGNSVAARTAGGVLAAIGLPDWVASDDEAYVALAAAKAQDVSALASLRGGLRSLIAASASGSPDRYADAIDAAYRKVWRAWCTGA